MSGMVDPRALRVKLAEAVGLPLDGLVSFSIDVHPLRYPAIKAVYQLKSAEGIEAVSKEFELRPVMMVSHDG